MTHCENCRERLLDFVFGLLEGNELEMMRAHVNACAQCQAELTKAQSQQKLMARAARAVTKVAEFALPSGETTAPTLPMTLPAVAPRRPIWRRAAVAWSAAAAVLLAVGLSIYSYNKTVDGYRDALAVKQNEHKKLAESFAALPVKHETLQKASFVDLRARTGPYLHVVGPRTLQPGAKAHLHITTRHLEGAAALSNLRIKLIEAESNKVAQVLRTQCDRDGQAVVELDAGSAKPGVLNLLIDAETGLGSTRIQEAVRLQEPTYVTRLDTNKIAYHTKDVLFYRVLALDRYSLQPPSQPIPLYVELADAKGQVVLAHKAPTGEGGMLSCEFKIDDKVPAGIYTLNVRPADANKTNLLPATQRLEIVRNLPAPESITLDKDSYLPGEQVTGLLRGARGTLPDNVKIDGQSVPLTTQPEPNAGPGLGGSSPPNLLAPKTNGANADLMYRFSAGPIPRTLSPGAREVRMVVPLQDGKKKLEIQGNIPIGPTDFTIDLFPEGGELIAGVQNRVFYRVRSKSGEPVTGEGQVMLLIGKNKIPSPELDTAYQFGMGYLDFIPDANETYTICVTTPAKTEHLTNPFAKLGIRSEGVVLQVADNVGEERVPRAVGNQGDPIRVMLRRQGPPRKLLVLAQCRGQIVDQRWVEVKQGSIDLMLNPTPDANGIIRVTAYELLDNSLRGDLPAALIGFSQTQVDKLLDGALQPIAERLVYRGAPQLDLGFEMNTNCYEPAKKLQAKITARDDKGQPTAAWVLASAVDERFQARPRSLSAHFFIVNEVRTGADLDNAQLILHDAKDKESIQVLERFLGTHGWRRFIRADELAVGKGTAQPLIFSRENMPLDVLQKQYEESLAKVDAQTHVTGFQEKEELEARRDRAKEAVLAAAGALARFEENIQVGIGSALGVGIWVLLAGSLIMMGIGAYRAIRAHKAATPAFGASFASLAACLGILFVGALIGPPRDTATPALAADREGWRVGQELETRLAHGPAVWDDRPEKVQTGAFDLRVNHQANRYQARLHEAQKADEKEAKDSAGALRNQLAQAFLRRTRDENLANTDRNRENKNLAAGSPQYNEFFGKDKAVPPSAPAAAPGGTVLENAKQGEVAAARKFAYEHESEFLADTLLWHPNLWLEAGTAEVRFDIGNGNQTYRVLLLGHSPAGRFGFYEKRLDVVGR